MGSFFWVTLHKEDIYESLLAFKSVGWAGYTAFACVSGLAHKVPQEPLNLNLGLTEYATGIDYPLGESCQGVMTFSQVYHDHPARISKHVGDAETTEMTPGKSMTE